MCELDTGWVEADEEIGSGVALTVADEEDGNKCGVVVEDGG